MTQVRLFCAPRFKPEKEDIRIIRSYGAHPSQNDPFLKTIPSDWNLSSFIFTYSIADADFVLIPQAVKNISPAWRTYFEGVVAEADSYGKKTIVFVGGDLAHRVHIKNDSVVVFKGAEYVSGRQQNEIIFPGYAEDLGAVHGVSPRRKNIKPTVSFCGYASFPNVITYCKYIVKNTALDMLSLVTSSSSYKAFKRGIYFRRAAMEYLRRSAQVNTVFIVRDRFTGKDVLDPARARDEYIENMVNSDFVLCPKGDGNYSIRFFEALSLGRIPILIDTEIVLPLQKVVDYSKCILRIPHTDLHRIGAITADIYESMSDEEFARWQEAARDAFVKYLRYDSFFNVTFPALKERGVDACG